MTHLNELYLILNKYLKWNKSHLKCFALIMLVIILKQTCNLSSASKPCPSSAYHNHFIDVCSASLQVSILIIVKFSVDFQYVFIQVQLTLDRTNLK